MIDAILRTLREVRRAPARILTSIFALALAVGAIGVLAIPTVSTSSLRDAAEQDGIPQIVLFVSDTGTTDVTRSLADVDEVDRVERQVITGVETADGDTIDVLGTEISDQEIDIVSAESGRVPSAFGEVLVTEGTAPLGSAFDVLLADGSPQVLTVVGIGGSTFWNDSDVVFSDFDTAAALDGREGANRLVIRTVDQTKASLRGTANEVRDALAADGIVTESLPFTIPGGRHPIEADIDQISSLIGFLGVVAGLVALVLLGSTANTLITERTREVAVMRALGASDRAMRRRLRRLALAIAGAAVVIGLPLGIAISNVIARMVLDEFVGLTPGFAVSVPVLVGSAAFALIGARIVAAGAAQRVTKRPLAEALRDRVGSPFGRRWSERMAARISAGSLLDRTAVRNGVHQRARSVAMVAQVTAAVAALMIIASLATTVTSYNEASGESVRWTTRSFIPGPGLDMDLSVADGLDDAEVGIDVSGELEGWGIDVLGFAPDTAMFDRTVDAGRWFSQPRDAVVSAGFAEQVGIDVGDRIDVELASGVASYDVVGLHPDRDRTLFVDREQLAIDLNRPGMGNTVMSLADRPPELFDGAINVQRAPEPGDDDDGTAAILAIFTAIGVVVVAVAGLAVAAGLGVNVFERRHEFAALQAIGGRRRHVLRVVLAELLPIAACGVLVGLAAGYLGARAIIGSFEASNAIEIGFVFATGAIPAAAGVVLLGSAVLGGLMVRRVTRQPAAVTLRGAA
ncbi:MAG: ABC transporter permease [Ilumatobacter sp.]